MLRRQGMKRREFLFIGPTLAALWPLSANAQQPRIPTIGVLVVGSADPAPFLETLRHGLAELGYVDGRNIRIEFRSAEGAVSRLPDLAAELVRQQVHVIVAWQTPTVQAAKQATRDIPIVMASAGDPVGTGLVASLARPGGNVTGSSSTATELAQKNLELLRELLPSLRRVALLLNAPDPFSKPFREQSQAAAGSL